MVCVECSALERRVQRLERRVAELALAPAVEAVERREQGEAEEVGERRERAALRPVGAAVQRLERRVGTTITVAETGMPLVERPSTCPSRCSTQSASRA